MKPIDNNPNATQLGHIQDGYMVDSYRNTPKIQKEEDERNETPQSVTPKEKPTTASISDIVKIYENMLYESNQGGGDTPVFD